MVNPLLLLAAAGAGYYFYTRSSSPAKSGEVVVADLTNGWVPMVNPKPLSLTQADGYAKVGVGVKFYLSHVHPSGTAIASPEAMANGTVESVEVGSDGKRYWKVKLTNVADAATYGAMPASLALHAVGAVFALTDGNLYG